MHLDIVKAHGTGNDFVVVEDLDEAVELDEATVAALCDRRRGVGADGVIRVAPGRTAPVFMDHRNADGSHPEMCGNGIRVLAKYCFDRGILNGSTAVVETRAGARTVVAHRDAAGHVCQVGVDMGPPAVGDLAAVLDAGGRTVTASLVGIGNPHAVMFVDDVAAAPVHEVGPLVETHDAFPDGVNVEFATVDSPGAISMRVWERGVGETASCGTGACAVAVVAAETGRASRRVDVSLPGGTLHIDYGDTVTLTGPAVEVFSARVDLNSLGIAEDAVEVG
ncbi:MAG: diaminopimelate epimerase [Acidimicrobiia bacterium]|nr:diaminopimelate epimerase [Acidimicrobiia bacterium]